MIYRFFICLVVLLLNWFPVFSQQKQSELELQHLQGKVKTLEEKEYNALEKEISDSTVEYLIDEETGIISHRLTEFNRRGNISEERIFDESGRLAAKTVYKHNEVGDLMEIHEYNEKGKKSGKTFFTYTSHRYYASQTIYLSDGSVEVATYYYDAKNPKLDLLDSVVWKSPDETRVEVFYYSKNVQAKATSDQKGKSSLSKPLPLEKRIFVNRKLKTVCSYTYNENGDVITETYRTPGKSPDSNYILSYTYNAQKQITSVTKSDARGMDHKIVWSYDDYGNVLAEKWYNGENEMISATKYVYCFDNQNNWTEQISFDENSRPNTIIFREISYY